MLNYLNAKTPVFSRSFTVGEVLNVTENGKAFSEAVTWVRTYLARPHPQLGRSGSVCPFAQPALDQDSLRIAVVRLTENNKRNQIMDAIRFHFQAFMSTASGEPNRVLQATLLLFPDVTLDEAPDLIDGVKEELKPSFIRQGLMLGEFHAYNESPGLHNPEFKPLRSPVPMLAIRRMVSTDLVFLNRSEYPISTRLEYLEAYLGVPNISETSRKEAERALASLMAEANSHAPQD